MLTQKEISEKLGGLEEQLVEIKRMLHYDDRSKELQSVQRELKRADLWDDPEEAKELGIAESRLQLVVSPVSKFEHKLGEAKEFLTLLDEGGPEMLPDLSKEVEELMAEMEKLEFEAMFNDANDTANAFVEIQAGQGGTEAQDWAEMLLRMYLKWADSHKITAEVLEVSAAEVAGIKSASIRMLGERAYGWLRTETGIHRLVRKSPFNANNKRHTSFASVFVTPEINASVEVDINAKDLRIDTYRASGAGGQHVNKTDSAVRITHWPTGVVVQCQNQRSQHQNKDSAMKQLRSKLYLLEQEKQNKARLELEESKDEISWGRQIRSYVLDDSRIKDLRTGIEKSDCPRVLNGDLDDFIIAGLQYQARMTNTGNAH